MAQTWQPCSSLYLLVAEAASAVKEDKERTILQKHAPPECYLTERKHTSQTGKGSKKKEKYNTFVSEMGGSTSKTF